MTLTAYRLRPLGPMHLGTGRADDLADLDDLPRSDTIAAALLSVWHHISKDGGTVSALATDPPFAVSSALPTAEIDGRHIILFPIPFGLLDHLTALQRPDKRIRRARFATSSILRELLAGRIPADVRPVGSCLLDGATWARFPSGLWRNDSRLRLAVNRLGDGPIEGLLYEFGSVIFAPRLSLTVVAAFVDAAIRPTFEAALALLGDEGLGADRSSGYGRLSVEAAEPFNVSLGKGMRLNLSLLHPSVEEIGQGLLDSPAAYDLVTRGGWVTAPGARTLRKQTVRMLSEGSVVRDLGRERYGDSPKVLDPLPALGLRHCVHRPGIAVTLPIEWPAVR